MKRDAADDWFSKCVRERAEWKCERGNFPIGNSMSCEKYYPEGANRMGLHCSHLFGRRRKSVRWNPLNCVAHCYSCHQRLGENPRLFSRWITEYLGSEKADELEALANEILHVTAKTRKEIAAHYRNEFKRMQALRAEGIVGRIEFEGWAA